MDCVMGVFLPHIQLNKITKIIQLALCTHRNFVDLSAIKTEEENNEIIC